MKRIYNLLGITFLIYSLIVPMLHTYVVVADQSTDSTKTSLLKTDDFSVEYTFQPVSTQSVLTLSIKYDTKNKSTTQQVKFRFTTADNQILSFEPEQGWIMDTTTGWYKQKQSNQIFDESLNIPISTASKEIKIEIQRDEITLQDGQKKVIENSFTKEQQGPYTLTPPVLTKSNVISSEKTSSTISTQEAFSSKEESNTTKVAESTTSTTIVESTQKTEPSTTSVAPKMAARGYTAPAVQSGKDSNTPLNNLLWTTNYTNNQSSAFINNVDYSNAKFNKLDKSAANSFENGYEMSTTTNGANLWYKKIVRPTNQADQFEVQLDLIGEKLKNQKNVDIVFVLDKSGSMFRNTINGVTRYAKMTSFIKDFSKKTLSSNSNNQIGLVSFESDDTIKSKIETFNNLGFTKDANAISNNSLMSVTYTNSGTPTFLGIDTGIFLLNNTKLGARSDSKKIMILLTDGEPSYWPAPGRNYSFPGKDKETTFSISKDNNKISGSGYSDQSENYSEGIENTKKRIDSQFNLNINKDILRYAIDVSGTTFIDNQIKLDQVNKELNELSIQEPNRKDYYKRVSIWFWWSYQYFDQDSYNKDYSVWQTKVSKKLEEKRKLENQLNQDSNDKKASEFLKYFAKDGSYSSNSENINDMFNDLTLKIAAINYPILDGTFFEKISSRIELLSSSVKQVPLVIDNDRISEQKFGQNNTIKQPQLSVDSSGNSIKIENINFGLLDSTINQTGYRLIYKTRLKSAINEPTELTENTNIKDSDRLWNGEFQDVLSQNTTTTTLTDKNINNFVVKGQPKVRYQTMRIQVNRSWVEEGFSAEDTQKLRSDILYTIKKKGDTEGVQATLTKDKSSLTFDNLPARNLDNSLITYEVSAVAISNYENTKPLTKEMSVPTDKTTFDTVLFDDERKLQTTDVSIKAVNRNMINLKNVHYQLIQGDKLLKEDVAVDSNGNVTVANLAAGDYTLVEKSVDSGYQKLPSYTFTLAKKDNKWVVTPKNATSDVTISDTKMTWIHKLKPFEVTIVVTDQHNQMLTSQKVSIGAYDSTNKLINLININQEYNILQKSSDDTHIKIDDRMPLKIADDGTVTFEYGKVKKVLNDGDTNNKLEITVVNSQKGQLPETGGNGHFFTNRLAVILVSLGFVVSVVHVGLQVRGRKR